MDPDISIIIPVYEEEQSLPVLTEEIKNVCTENNITFEVWLVDDGSRDNSWNVITDIHSQDARFSAVRFRRNYGKSAALAAGFERARGTHVVTMDADLQDDPAEIPALLSMIQEEKLDLISGWKKVRNDPLSKKIPSRWFNLVTRLVSGIRLHDFNCGLKIYRRPVVQSLRVYGEMHRYLPLLAKWEGYDRIGEKIVAHRARPYGRTKFGLERYLRGFLDLLTVMFLTRFTLRPMHFFGTLGTVAFLTGFLISLFLTIQKLLFGGSLGDRPLLLLGILLIIVGVQTFCTGFIADLVISRRMDEHPPYHIVDMTDAP